MAEESLYDSEAMRRFAGIELGDDRIPDETTILNFRHLLERHGLTEAIFAEVNADLAGKGVTLRSGTLVDATIIDAPSSTKNRAKARDPEMSSNRKGNDWYFGMKAHVGVDADSGIVHSLETTTAKTHDSQSGMSCYTAQRHRSGPIRAMCIPDGRRPSPRMKERSGMSCARRPRAANSTRSTIRSTGSSRRRAPVAMTKMESKVRSFEP